MVYTAEALKACLADYQTPVGPQVLGFQIELAIREASDLDFIPAALREPSAREGSTPTV